MSWISMQYESRFDFDDIHSNRICIGDIACALSNICRFNGHIHPPKWYSVAEHSLNVEREVAELYPNDYNVRMSALLHDAAEAYIGDLVRPLKEKARKEGVTFFDDLENEIWNLIANTYGLDNKIPEYVKYYDNKMVTTEKGWFFIEKPKWDIEKFYPPIPHLRPNYLLPHEVMPMFLDKFEEITELL